MIKAQIVDKERCNSDEKVSLYAKTLCIYFLCLPLGALNLSDTLGSLLRYIALLPLCVWILSVRDTISIPKKLFAQMVWIAFLVLSCVWSINISGSISRAITNVMFLLLLVPAATASYNVVSINSLKQSLMWSSRITALVTLLFGSYIKGRLYLGGTITEDPNYLCAYFLFGITAAVQTMQERVTYKKKVLCMLELLAYAYIVLATGSRGGMLAVIVTVMAALLFTNAAGASSKRITTILLIGISVILAVSFVPEAIMRRFTWSEISESEGTGRFEIWENGLKVFSRSDLLRQLFGYGTATIRDTFAKFGFVPKVMHNMFLEVLLENGVIGLVLYVAMIVQYYVVSVKERNFYALAILSGLVVLSLSTSIYAFKPYWNIMIYIICVLRFGILQRKKKVDTRI